MKCKTLVFVAFAVGILVSSCKRERYPAGGPYYYAGWRHYEVPFQPTGRISYEEAKRLGGYSEAFFDGDGRILRLKKIVNGQVVLTAGYTYRADGRLERGEVLPGDGRRIVQGFDREGRLTATTESEAPHPIDAGAPSSQ